MLSILEAINAYGAMIFMYDGIVTDLISLEAKTMTSNSELLMSLFPMIKFGASSQFLKFLETISTFYSLEVDLYHPSFNSIKLGGSEMLSISENKNTSCSIKRRFEFGSNLTLFRRPVFSKAHLHISVTCDGIVMLAIANPLNADGPMILMLARIVNSVILLEIK